MFKQRVRLGGDLGESLQGPTEERWWFEENPEQGLERMGCCGRKLEEQGCLRGGLFGGVVDDYRRRLPNYWRDFTQGITPKTLSSALFMFFATFFSTASLGVLVQKSTNNRVGLEEYLLMNSIAGMTHALFGCQPLLVLRPTGPITAIMGTLNDLADHYEIDFYQYLGCTGFFVGFYMSVIAGTEFCRMIKHLTRFTHDIFAFFVCSLYILDGINGAANDWHDGLKGDESLATVLFGALLAVIVFCISMWLNLAITWTSFNDTLRTLITDYAVTIAVAATIIAAYIWQHVEGHHVDRIVVPEALWTPTCSHDSMHLASNYSSKWNCICDSAVHCLHDNVVANHSSTNSSARSWTTDYNAPKSGKIWVS
jgi:hypothetical protein